MSLQGFEGKAVKEGLCGSGRLDCLERRLVCINDVSVYDLSSDSNQSTSSSASNDGTAPSLVRLSITVYVLSFALLEYSYGCDTLRVPSRTVFYVN